MQFADFSQRLFGKKKKGEPFLQKKVHNYHNSIETRGIVPDGVDDTFRTEAVQFKTFAMHADRMQAVNICISF